MSAEATPTGLLATQVYVPSSSALAKGSVRFPPWTPSIGAPCISQLMRGAGFPSAEHWKKTSECKCAICESGECVMVGASVLVKEMN